MRHVTVMLFDDFTRMKLLKILILVAIVGISLVLPWTEFGELGIHFMAPVLLGVLVPCFFRNVRIRVHVAVLCGLFIPIAFTRICWEAAILQDGFLSLNRERNLIAMSVAIQFLFAAAAFVTTWFVLQRRNHVVS